MAETSNEAQAQVCPICSALAADMAKHRAWHRDLPRVIGKVLHSGGV